MKSPRPSDPPQASRLNLVLLAVFAFLLIAASIVLLLTIPKAGTQSGSLLPSDTTSAPLVGFDTSAAEASQLFPFGDSVVKVTPDRAARLDMTGSERFTVALEMNTPFVITEGDRLLIFDKDGHGYVVLSASGEVSRGSTDALLRGAALSPDGHFALITDPPDSTGVVRIFSPTGQWLFDCLFPDSGFVLSVAFTKDSSAFDVSLLNTDGSDIYPVLKRLTLTGETLGQRILDDATLYPLIMHDHEQNPVLCGRTGLVAVTYKASEPVFRLTLPAIHTVAGSGSGLVVVDSESVGATLRLSVLKDGIRGQTLDIGEEMTQLAVRDQLAVIASGSRLVFVDLEKTAALGEIGMGSEIVRIGFAGGQTMIVITRAGARLVTIPKK